MPRRKKRNASRGSVNNIILKTLVTGDKYGYEIIKQVEEFSNGKFKLKQPSLYSSLSRFEEKEFVTSYWGDSDIGGRRHYYHITDLGLDYYRRNILKEEIIDEEIEEVDNDNDFIEEGNVDDNKLIEQSHSNEIPNDEIVDDDVFEDKQFSDSNNSIIELDNEDLPAIVDFNDIETNNSANDEIVCDHVFYKQTPFDNIINQTTSSKCEYNEPIKELQDSNVTFVDEDSEDEYENYINEYDSDESSTAEWNNIVVGSRQANKKLCNSKFKKLYLHKPKKVQKIIMDKDGILKLRDEDYVAQPTKKYNPVIIDNVGKRNTPVDIYGHAEYTTDKKSPSPNSYNEISEEEKLRRNENFLAKFNLLTKSKMKPVSAPVQKVVEKKQEISIDYRGKLDAIYGLQLEDNTQNYITEDNKIFEYDNDFEDISTLTEIANTTNEEPDDPFVQLEETMTFNVKEPQNEYIEEINNVVTPPNQIQLTRYQNTTKAVLDDKTYLLINKLKIVFGILMTLIMFAEIAVSWILLSKNNLIMGNNIPLILSCIVVGIFALIYSLPYMFNSNTHKANTFKFKYSFWFGVLTFLISTILTYCVNALNGFQLDNFSYFATTIIMPIVMSSNFIIGPIIYLIVSKFKTFYD